MNRFNSGGDIWGGGGLTPSSEILGAIGPLFLRPCASMPIGFQIEVGKFQQVAINVVYRGPIYKTMHLTDTTGNKRRSMRRAPR